MAEKPSHGFRKVPTVNPSTASAFVALDAAPAAIAPVPHEPAPAPVVAMPVAVAPPPRAPAPEPAPSRSRRKTVVRADGRELRKQTIYLEPELSTRLAVHCAQTGKDISEIVAQAVSQFLGRNAR